MNRHYRAAPAAWIFIGGISNFPWLFVWADSVHGFIVTDWLFAILLSCMGLVWLFRFRITITQTELIFRSLMHGTQRVKHGEIKKIHLAWKLWRTTRPPFRLVVERRDDKKPMEINAKVFSREAIDAVLDLGARVAEADDDGLRDGIIMKSLRDGRRRHDK